MAATILVRLFEEDGAIRIVVRDSGPGFPAEPRPGLGTVLVDALVGQLGGTLERGNEGGARVSVVLPREAPVPERPAR